jgi:hypothetical protein
MFLFYWSANRDEKVFEDPYRFDITRGPNPHLTFGSLGPRFCLGAHLVRMESSPAVESGSGTCSRIRWASVPDMPNEDTPAWRGWSAAGPQQRPVVRPALPVRGEQRLDLDRVAERGAGAVRLDGVHLRRRQPGARQGLPDHPLVRGTVRRGQAVRGAVLVDRGTAYGRKRAVAESLSPIIAKIGQLTDRPGVCS